MKRLGFWKEFRGEKLPSLFEVANLKERQDEIYPSIMAYLKKGVWLTKLRTVLYCPITRERIGIPFTYTDGEWFWTTEYIYYLQNYNLDLPKDLLRKMQNVAFKAPSEEELGNELIDSLEEEIKFYGY